ncbi:hypothetical protein GQ600_13592 [Phytophthora cactorum]|nr:hypothetical protein GQ600_13592 [Phytophthora cactorum]
MAVTPVTMASSTKKEDRAKEAATSSSTAGSRLEVRSWEKLHPHGDVYSPRTGHTVTSKGTLCLNERTRVEIKANLGLCVMQMAECMSSAAQIADDVNRISLTPPSLLDICADYVRTNLDAVLETTTFKGVPLDIIDHVVFKRDLEGRLRGKCKLCDQAGAAFTEFKRWSLVHRTNRIRHEQTTLAACAGTLHSTTRW